MLTDKEQAQLAAAKAFEEAYVKPLIDDLSAKAKDDLIASGYDKAAIKINGEKVGEVALAYSKPRPYVLVDHAAEALQWFAENGLVDASKIERCLIKDWQNAFECQGNIVIDKETGEALDFLGWQAGTVLAPKITGCKLKDARGFTGVEKALQPSLNGGNIVTYLLEGAQDVEQTI